MQPPLATPVRMTLVGAQHTPFRQAAEMAREAGALVTMADDEDTALAQLSRAGVDLVMVDVELDVPRLVASLRAERIAVPILACGIGAPAERAVAAVRGGARDYLPLPPQRELIAAAILSVARAPQLMVRECEAMRRTVDYALAMASSAAPVLIRGEPGTGKEVLARLIHAASHRPGHFISVECQGMAQDMLQSELFGHEPGAFAGALARRIGRLDEARGGTVFLRGVEALGPLLQAGLLHALQAGEICSTGTAAGSPLATRLITSTAADIRSLAERGLFRADLLARLSLAEIGLPPLRDRAADIDALARQFAAQFATTYAMPPRSFDKAAMALLHSYSWPGNVRELEETVHRAVLLAQGETIGTDALVLADGTRLEQAEPAFAGEIQVDGLVGHTVAEVERELILHTLEHCGGNRTSASSILGISVRTMRNKLKSFVQAGIPVAPSH